MNKHAPSPAPDLQSIERFVSVVFSYLEGFVPIRILREKGGPERKPVCLCEPVGEGLSAALLRHAHAAGRAGAGLFLVPGATAAQGRGTAAQIIQTAVILVDLDAGDVAAKRAHLVRHLGAPTLEVASGGLTPDDQRKLQIYWRLTEAAAGPELAQVCHLRGLLAGTVGGDLAFASPHQLIRVPGSVHRKFGKSRPVEILGGSNQDYDLAELVEAVEAMPSIEGCEPPRSPKLPRASGLMTRRVHEGGADGVTCHDALTKMVGHWLRQLRLGSITIDEAWRAVCEHNAALIAPAWDEADLRREFDALRLVDQRNLPTTADVDVSPDPSSQPTGEDALAAAFTAAHGEDWRHVLAWGR